jgi:sporulation protein YqfC
MRMKPRKPKAKRNRKETVSLRGMLAQPPSAFYRLPEFELRGGYLVTEGCRRVLDFEPEKICLDMGNFIVTFYGTELRIESLTGKRLILAGRIANISFRNKWEVSEHGT